MKIKKSLNGLFIGLAASGVLLAGGMSVYAPAQCFAEEVEAGQDQKSSDEVIDKQNVDDDDSDKKNGANADKETKEKSNQKQSATDIAQNAEIAKIKQDITEKADGYVLYLSLLAFAMGLCGAGLALLSMSRANAVNRKWIREIDNLGKHCSSLQKQIEDLKKRLDESDTANATLQQQLSVLDLRVRKSREAEYRYEINNNAPISSDNGGVPGERRILKQQEPKLSPEEQLKQELFQEYGKIKSEYVSLISLWKGHNGPGYRKARSDFQEKYGVVEFSCINAEQRMKSNEPPVFYTVSSKGDFWAIASNACKGLFFVYPSATLSYEVQAHTTGGMKEAFDSNYRPGVQKDGDFSVDRPAFFIQDGNGWHIRNKGKLTFM